MHTVPQEEPKRPSVGISWSDITFKVKALKGMTKGEDGFTELIHGVSGFANPGQVLALMGGSGAGKTTLLNILSDRLANPKNTKIAGNVRANGQDVKSIDYKTYIGYVMQDDILLDTMTPRECLQFSANMRVHGTAEQKRAKVEQLLEDLKLTSVANNRIGSTMIKGISGGERRRTSIGVELITNPSAVFLDGKEHVEPTSGLDSFTALTVMTVLKSLAKSGVTIVCTIHQPSTDIFNLFDRLQLLTEGHVVYQGPASEVRTYFDELGYVCPPLTNPADHFMNVLHIVDRHNMTQEETDKIDFFAKKYIAATHNEAQNQLTDDLPQLSRNDYHYKASYGQQLRLLAQRSVRNTARNPIITRVRFMQLFVFMVIIILLFNDLGSGREGIQNRAGALFFMVINMLMLGIQNSLLAFPIERALFLKEQGMGMYGVVPYFQSKNIAEFPIQIFPPFIYFAVVYFGLQLNTETADKFFIFCLVLLLVHLCGCSIGLLLGSAFPNIRVALNAGPVRTKQLAAIPLMLFGGFFSNQNSIPVAWQWVSYCSVPPKQPFRYAFQALAINEFTDLHLDCMDDKNPCNPLKQFDFGEGLWTSVYVLIGMTVGVRMLSLVFLKLLVRKLGS